MKRFRSSPPPPPPSPWAPGFDVATALHAFAHSFAGAFALITTAALCFVALLHYREQRLNIPLSKQRLRSLIAIADAGMAGTFLVLGIEMLQGLEAALHRLFDADVQLFNPRMLASMAIFSINATPPTPRAFSICTLSAFFAGGALHALGYVGHEAEIYAVGLHVMLSKLSASNFAPCIGLAAYAAQKPWATGEPFYFLLSPWISGHIVLYLFALAAAVPRRAIRVWLARHEWSVLQRKQVHRRSIAAGSLSLDDRVARLFERYDTSGDGRIDAAEFRIAYRSVAGEDLAAADCDAVIRAFDAEGHGGITLSEFREAVLPWLVGK